MTDVYADSSALDETWLAEPRRRSRLRWGLVVVLLASLVFLGGVEVQQRWGSAASSAAVAGPGAGGFPGGGPGAGAGAGAGGGAGAAGTSTGDATAAPTGSTATAAAPSVIGTVTAAKGTTWTVTDLGGTAHQVTVPAGLRAAAGTTVSIVGTADASGVVTATAVTVRSTSTQGN